jgi:hypothetical protein
MPKFNKGDRVILEGRVAIIEHVHFYLPKADGSRKKMIWYEVRFDGMHSKYAVSQKANLLQKAKAGV